MSPTKRPSAVPGLRAALQGPPRPAPAAAPRAPAPGPEAPRPAAPRPPRPPRPVRYTLDLDPADHLHLKRFALDAGVSASVIVRALLAELRADPALADRVRSAVWPE